MSAVHENGVGSDRHRELERERESHGRSGGSTVSTSRPGQWRRRAFQVRRTSEPCATKGRFHLRHRTQSLRLQKGSMATLQRYSPKLARSAEGR